MEFYKTFIYGLIAFVIGVFAFSNIFMTLFYTIPRLKKEKQLGRLIKRVPPMMLAWPVLFGFTVIGIGLYFSYKYYSDHIVQIYVGLGFSAVVLLRRNEKKSNDMNDDFNKSYKDYLK